jgi:hypothetical protein
VVLDASRLATRACRVASAITVGVAAVLVLYWGLATIRARPTMAGETEILFEAARMRAGLRLYVDPIAGAHDYGPLPARYLVTYPPLWSWVVSHVPTGEAALLFARGACTLAWLAALSLLVGQSRAPGQRPADTPRGRITASRRGAALAAAAFFAGSFNVALFADSGRPDSIAILLATIALWRSMRDARVDAASGALFALAAWTKPTVVGLAAGALVAAAFSPRGVRAGLAGAAAVSLVVVALLERAGGHAWFTHLVASNLQPISLDAWLDAMRHDAFFFVGPVVYAAAIGWRARRDAGVAMGLAALAGAFAWALFSRAKIGSSTNYWMESAIGVVALCARAPAPPFAARPALAAMALAQSLWVGIASVKSATYRVAADPRIGALLDQTRSLCGAGPADFVMSDDAAAELRIDGRIYTTAYQMTFLAFAGKFPVGPWVEDLERPEVRCFVEHTGIMRFLPDLDRALRDRFEPVASTDDWTVLRARR